MAQDDKKKERDVEGHVSGEEDREAVRGEHRKIKVTVESEPIDINNKIPEGYMLIAVESRAYCVPFAVFQYMARIVTENQQLKATLEQITGDNGWSKC